jgi:hypothetical protein
VGWEIRVGTYGDLNLGGVRFVRIFSWPGPIHEGNGTRQMIVDVSASGEQRDAMESLESGTSGGAVWEIFAAVCPHRLDTVYAPIEFELDMEARRGTLRVEGAIETESQPILNPITGEPHRVRIDLPNGFEYKQAEIGNTVFARVKKDGGVRMEMNLERTYAQMNPFDWSNG